MDIRQLELRLIRAAIFVLSNEEAQDRTLLVDMVDTMLRDICDKGKLDDMITYVRAYCDTADNEEEIKAYTRRILELDHEILTGF